MKFTVRKLRRSVVATALAVGVVPLVLAACGGGDDESATPAETDAATPAETTSEAAPADTGAAAAPAEGGITGGIFPGSVEPGSLATKANERYKIIMLSASDVIPGWHGYNIGARDAAEALGVDLEIAQWASLEPADLVAGVNAVAAKNPDAALFSAVQSQALQGAFEQAAERGIPIVVFDSPADDPSFAVTYVGSPAAEEGRAAADVLCELIGGEGTVLQTDANPGFSTLVINANAFREQFEANCPNAELLPLEYDDGDTAKNASIMRATLASHPDLAGAYLGTSGLGGRGGVSALREAGKAGEVKVVTLDGLPGAIEDLQNGYQHAVTSVKLHDLGWLAVEAAVAHLNGETDIPKEIHTGYCILTPDNLDDPEIEESFCKYPSESPE